MGRAFAHAGMAHPQPQARPDGRIGQNVGNVASVESFHPPMRTNQEQICKAFERQAAPPAWFEASASTRYGSLTACASPNRLPSVAITSRPYYRFFRTGPIQSPMEKGDGIAKLTEREKLCLRQWLQHKSAKEIAAEIGISHHAVEKRLKMARIKLGAASSLHAARMLGEAEGYGRTVSHSPDLPSPPAPLQSVVTRPLILGAIMMSLVAGALLALAAQPAGKTPAAIERAVLTREYDHQLDAVLRDLIAAAQVDADGDIRLERPVGDDRYLVLGSGRYWQISARGHEDFASRSLWDRKLRVSDRKGATETIHYDSDQFPNEPLRVAERTVRLPGSDVEWHFIVARARGKSD